MNMNRALHFVFKIADRTSTMKFYREILGMKVLRHEEFEEQCKASCNGPYDGKWSKTMIGYGPEDQHFVIELTYNYGIGCYTRGNDLIGVTINSAKVLENVRTFKWPMKEENGIISIDDPNGYTFFLINDKRDDRVTKLTLSCADLKRTVKYWNELLGMDIYERTDKSVLMGYGKDQCKVEFNDIGECVNHAKAFGRIAFSCPENALSKIEKKIKDANETILTPLVTLDTPGKASVTVVILADPDAHEICFVGDDAFRLLSQIDVNADELLNEAISKDKSEEWFNEKGISKETK